jgi:hypothetical protein
VESFYRLTGVVAGVITGIFQPSLLLWVGLFIVLVPAATALTVFKACRLMGASKTDARGQAVQVLSRICALPRGRDPDPPES